MTGSDCSRSGHPGTVSTLTCIVSLILYKVMKFFVKPSRKIKLTVFLILLGLLRVSANTSAQTTRVNLQLENVMLSEVIDALREQTHLEFFYSNKELDVRQKVSVKAENEVLESVLKGLLGEKYDFRISDNVVYIRPVKEEEQKQPVVIKGVVKDDDGNMLPGVTIILKGLTLGTTTDGDGKFTLTVPRVKDQQIALLFSFVGMKTQEVTVKDNKPLVITMENDVNTMEEVVVNGMFTQNRNSYTGSVTTIKSEDILRVSQTNLLQALSILTPGMRIEEDNAQGSNPNHIPEIIIRGTSSISATGQQGLNRPLIMLDGVEITLEQLYDLDMFDIDRVDVLKDASATAIYGDKASNGVIVVTRKRVTDSKLKVRYNFVPNVQFPDVSSFNYCDAAQKLELERMYDLYKSTTGEYDKDYYAKLERVHAGVNTDWIAKPLRNSWSFDHSLNMTGRGGGLDYSASIRYGDVRGVMKGDFRQNYGVGFYFSYRFKEKLLVSFRSDWTKTDSKSSPYGNFSDFTALNPYDVPKDEDGNWNKILSWERRNPLYDATTNSFEKMMSKNFSNSVTLRWDIIKGLYINGTFNYTWSDSQNEKFDSPESSTWVYEDDLQKKGSYDINGTNGQSWNFQSTISYNLRLNKEGSSLLTTNVGGTMTKSRGNSFAFSGIGFLKPSLNDIGFASQYPTENGPSGSESLNTSLGIFGNMNLIVRNKYFVDGSYRLSGNSNYGAKDLYASYWSLGVGWNIHNENFLKDSWVNILRLKGSMGYVGNGNFTDIKPYTIYKYRIENVYSSSIGAIPASMGNDQLKAERQLQLNFGVSASFLNERLDITFDIYRQQTKDMMLDISMPPSAGITSTKANLGEKINTGYDWSVSAQVIRTNDIFWRITLNSSHTKDKIKKISNALKRQSDRNRDTTYLVTSPKIQFEEGESADAIYAVRSLGIDPATGKEVFIKKDGTRTFNYDPQDKVALGSATPKFNGNVTTSFTYKRVSVNVAMNFTLGGYIYNTTRAVKIENINPKQNADKRAFTQRWKQEGDIVDYIKIEPTGVYAHSERFVEKKNELNISSLGIMYDMNPGWVKKIGLKKLMVGVQFSDVARISTVKYERGTSYPYMRGFNFTISPTF